MGLKKMEETEMAQGQTKVEGSNIELTEQEVIKAVGQYQHSMEYHKEYQRRPEVIARKKAKRKLEKAALKIARERGLI